MPNGKVSNDALTRPLIFVNATKIMTTIDRTLTRQEEEDKIEKYNNILTNRTDLCTNPFPLQDIHSIGPSPKRKQNSLNI